ncbi:MAG: enoyl-CoA hydratase/isomerase family protein, partial [Brachymonas sp.]|nr:enoyl-CoA hydratase/isomerase family protein [Brachymonas sp.]
MIMSEYRKILFSIDEGIARITLNRPDKRNALDGEIISEIRDAVDRTARDESAGVILVAGAGKDFCSGADLAALQRISEATVMDNVSGRATFAELFIAMRNHPRPIIAAVRGRALAGGC